MVQRPGTSAPGLAPARDTGGRVASLGKSLADDARPRGQMAMRRLRAVFKAVAILFCTLPLLLVQAVMLVLPGRGKVVVARGYWAMVARLLGVRTRLVGQAAGRSLSGRRPVIYAANHVSWLDIAILGGQLEAVFVSKAEVGRWPGISLIAKLGRTVFVSRRAADTARERDGMRQRLAAGDNLLLFPEGTSSDGSRVMAFRTPFFAVAMPDAHGQAPLVQPVSLAYDQLAGLPTGRASRPLFAWYGDMDLGSHLWRLMQWRGMRATVLLHPPLDPADFADRKALAQATWKAVADGAAQLRQNRPPEPPAELH
jgi:1-acyl-sn-glycerol-3-phosphate acyltransferase